MAFINLQQRCLQTCLHTCFLLLIRILYSFFVSFFFQINEYESSLNSDLSFFLWDIVYLQPFLSYFERIFIDSRFLLFIVIWSHYHWVQYNSTAVTEWLFKTLYSLTPVLLVRTTWTYLVISHQFHFFWSCGRFLLMKKNRHSDVWLCCFLDARWSTTLDCSGWYPQNSSPA